MRRFLYFIPAASIALAIVLLSLSDGQDLPEVDILNADKAAHLLCYFVFNTALVWGFYKATALKRSWLSASIAFVFGVAMELLQHFFIPSRHFDLLDIVANGMGCILCVLVVPFLVES